MLKLASIFIAIYLCSTNGYQTSNNKNLPLYDDSFYDEEEGDTEPVRTEEEAKPEELALHIKDYPQNSRTYFDNNPRETDMMYNEQSEPMYSTHKYTPRYADEEEEEEAGDRVSSSHQLDEREDPFWRVRRNHRRRSVNVNRKKKHMRPIRNRGIKLIMEKNNNHPYFIGHRYKPTYETCKFI